MRRAAGIFTGPLLEETNMPEITFTEMPAGALVVTGTITPSEEGEKGVTYPLVSICEDPGFSHWLEAMEAGRKPILAKRWLTCELVYRNDRYTVGFTGQGSGRATIKPVHLDAMEGPQDFRIEFDGEVVTYTVGAASGQSKTYLTAEPGDDMVVMFGFPGGTKAANKPPLGATISYEITTLAEGDEPA
jgi:hypothetical protein